METSSVDGGSTTLQDPPPSYDELFSSTSTTVVDSGSFDLAEDGASTVEGAQVPQDGNYINYSVEIMRKLE